MAPVTDDRIREFLADTLALWQVEGSVEALAPPVVAVIRTSDGSVVEIERAAPGLSFRWLVRSVHSGGLSLGTSGRPCASLVGLLNALRRALGIDDARPVRIARGES